MTTLDLDTLLAERPDDARARAAGAFAAAAGERPIVLHGAGGVGRSVLAALRAGGIEPVCFSDGGAQPGAQPVDGVDVLPMAEAVARHGADAVFVVTILNPRFPYNSVRDALAEAGAQLVVPWILVGWAHPEGLLPHYAVDLPHRVLEQADDVRAAYALLADDASREQFLVQLAWRLTADFDVLGGHLPTSEQYFSADVIALADDDVFVDCGAYDGDTVASLIEHHPAGVQRIYALEPDPDNLEALNERLADLGPAVVEAVEVLPWAAGAERGTARWALPGTSSAGMAEDGEIEVEVAPLDELLHLGVAATYIKMDIEGAEPDALNGARATIARHRPALAVCIYHAQDHLWSLPLLVASLVEGDYTYKIRRYLSDCWEVVLYAIPAERPL
ncbi:FkbM family methyltransferase [Conexibacter woesei]|uniref:FkbM family methyltransferase n=1 Tax=Conexibacter woesei TaxID=191495 RepID=UPI0003F740E1|nr:FkbM family methyltransferase [Conexibacter woesei]